MLFHRSNRPCFPTALTRVPAGLFTASVELADAALSVIARQLKSYLCKLELDGPTSVCLQCNHWRLHVHISSAPN
jgi:hypothetical protein